MKVYQYILISLFLVATSCTKIDEDIYSGIPIDKYPENEDQVSSLSVTAYNYLKPLIDDDGWWYLAQEVSSDEMVFPTRDTDWDDGGKWRVMHEHNWTNDVEGVNRMWEKFWEGISNINKLIEVRLMSLPQDESIEKQIKQVETLRGFFYYLLLDNYGDVPYLSTFVNAPELPTKLPRVQVFDSVVTNLENNLPDLKKIDRKNMATRYMAHALLAKLYLNAEVYTGTPNWEKAEDYIDSVLNGPFSLANDVLAPFVTENQNNSEIIFAIPYDENNYQGFRLHMRTLHYQHDETYKMTNGPWNGGAVMPEHFELYDSNDARLSYFIYGPQFDIEGKPIIESSTKLPLNISPEIPDIKMNSNDHTQEQIKTSGARIGKYEIKTGAKENLSNDFVLFRLTDFILMKAEVELRKNGVVSNGTLELVNKIRERANVAEFTAIELTLDKLLEERGRELFAEGHRRQDLIRFGKWEGSWEWKEIKDESYRTFPIPKWATDANPNLLK